MLKLYQLGIFLYGLCVYVLTPFVNKAKQWHQGQKTVFDLLPKANSQKKIWIHCASLGEFEQVKPLIKVLKQKFPEYHLLITFFSPSGFLNTTVDKYIDTISYLPLDTLSNSQKFIQTVKPSVALFVKNEFWPNYLSQLQNNKIPTFIISGIFRKNQFFFSHFGKWHLSILKNITHFFVQDPNSQTLLHKHGINQVSICGDTRFDRIEQNVLSFEEIPLIKAFKNNTPLIVCGSTYSLDSSMLIRISQRNPHLKFIIAPHNIDLCHQLKRNALLYSEANPKTIKNHSILVIDNIGMLSKLYHYASVAYVGGGFGKNSLHNILEPMAFNIPTLFGPNYHRFNEAIDAIKQEVAFSISSEMELETKLKELLLSPTQKTAISAFCKSKTGATNFIFESIKEQL